MRLIHKSIARVEAFFKGMVFDCHSCGQCVLQKTGLICPMSCPKGLRNGPCGGTLGDHCEVYPDKGCVWVRIHERTARGSLELPKLLPSPDANLFDTSSYVNMLTGRDKPTREYLDYLDLPKDRVTLPVQTGSLLERRLKAGHFVKTCEIRSPREADFTHFRREAEIVNGHFDAVNATAFLNGRPSLPSPRGGMELVRLGIEPISQATCRDHTKTSFISELIQNQMNGIHNTLCLTGDSYSGTPKIKQVFDLDSALMLFEARYLRERGVIHFTGQKMKKPPRSFLGGALNPLTEPRNIPLRRLKQKAAAGADFIQTQIIFDLPGFREFMALYCQEGLDRELFLLAGVPVVLSKKAFAMVPHLPGIRLPEDVRLRLEGAADFAAEGIRMARETVQEMKGIPGVRGVHLMLFGMDHTCLPEIVKEL